MADFLKLLEAVCGHKNETLFVIKGAGFCLTMDLSIRDFEFIRSDNDLKFLIDTGDFGTLWFHNVHSVEPGGRYDDEPDYRFYFDGGEAEMTVSLG